MSDNWIRKALVFAVIVLFIGVGFVPSISSDEPISRGTIYVDDDASPGWYNETHVRTIQEGIDNATSGDTVFVYNGTYYENVVVNKCISVNSIFGPINCIIDAIDTNDNAIMITSDNVNLSGFWIKNSYNEMDNGKGIELNDGVSYCNISHNIVTNNDAGIYLAYLNNNNTIFNNIVLASFDGIISYYGNNNHIINNSLSDNSHVIILYGFNNEIKYNSIKNTTGKPIYLRWSNNNKILGNILNNGIADGIELDYSNFNNISNNLISNFSDVGIRLDESSKRNNVTCNDILLCCRGISIEIGVIENSVYRNKIKDNQLGIYLNTNNNLIYNNYFENMNNVNDNGNNIWNITKTLGINIIGGPYIGGNFWSDYNGTDTDGDGLGDTNIPYGPGDYLPLTAFLDVNQSIQDRGFPIRHALDGDWGAAQNFTPTLDTLTSVDIYLRKFGAPEFNLTIELRIDGPEGTLLDTVVFTPSEVASSWTWLNIDFNDVNVGVGSDVFIVLPPAPSGVTTSFGYEWGYAFGNQYDDGAFWFTRDGGGLWRDLPTMYEFVFRTYGYS